MLSVFAGEVVCEPPNNKLDRFCGTLYWRGSKYTLTNQNMLLRGCVLRNTESCYGLVIFAGMCVWVCGWPSFKNDALTFDPQWVHSHRSRHQADAKQRTNKVQKDEHRPPDEHAGSVGTGVVFPSTCARMIYIFSSRWCNICLSPLFIRFLVSWCVWGLY